MNLHDCSSSPVWQWPTRPVSSRFDENRAGAPGIRERVFMVDSPLIDLASHDLQRRIRENLSLRYMVPDEVIDYIRMHQLYQLEPAQ